MRRMAVIVFSRLLFRIIFIQLLLLLMLSLANGERTHEKIYVNLQGTLACFRRLNGTHQTGCTSKRGGSVGVIQIVAKKGELEDMLSSNPFHPFIITIPPSLYTWDSLSQMRSSGKVNGVLILFDEEKMELPTNPFSPDKKCPNMKYGMYRGEYADLDCKLEYNTAGQNVMFEDWGFPIFLVKRKEDIDNIRQCFNAHNNDTQANQWPFCAAELNSYMQAAKDSETCIRRSKLHLNLNTYRVCDPLGDRNIWSSLQPMNKSSPLKERSLIVLAARIDAGEMFDGYAPGAVTTITGLVTLLAIAEELSKVKDELLSDKNILFLLFNGEAYDYIGSSRMVYDMEKGLFPTTLDDNVVNQPPLINLTHIDYFIELSQLLPSYPEEKLFVHTDPLSNDKQIISNKIKKLIKILQEEGQKTNLSINESSPNQPLPVASLQSFLLKDKNISGLVLANYNTSFTNRFYNSIFDAVSNIRMNRTEKEVISNLTAVATTISRSIYRLVTNSETEIAVNETRIEELLFCFLNNSNCTLFQTVVDPKFLDKLTNDSFSLYVGVDRTPANVAIMVIRTLSYLTGEEINDTEDACKDKNNEDMIFSYLWINGVNGTGKCIRSTTNYSVAVSPAFDIEDYDFSSGLYSTWTESTWDETTARIFLKPSQQWEIIVLCIGIFIFLSSLVIVWYMTRNSVILFTHSHVGC